MILRRACSWSTLRVPSLRFVTTTGGGRLSILPKRLRIQPYSIAFPSDNQDRNLELKHTNGHEGGTDIIHRSRIAIGPGEPFSGYVDLSSRRSLIQVSGIDAHRFLHGLLTNEPPVGQSGVYATFLSVKGRIMYDVFIYPVSHNKKWNSSRPQDMSESYAAVKAGEEWFSYLIEVDSALAPKLLAYLRFRKLRERVAVRRVDDWKVWFVWEDFAENYSHRLDIGEPTEYDLNPYLRITPQFIGADDTRAPGLGVRIVLSREAVSPLWPLRIVEEGRVEYFSQQPLELYDRRRVMYGVAEGAAEFHQGEMLPMESCIDMMGGINFSKGCYVGQELVTRAKRLGITRRRLAPFELYDLSEPVEQVEEVEFLGEREREYLIPADKSIPYKAPIVPASEVSKINSKGEVARPIGRIITLHGNIGLASVMMDWIDKGADASPCRVVPEISHTEVNSEVQKIGEGQTTKAELDLSELGHEGKGIGIRFYKPFWWRHGEQVHDSSHT
ncbi:uncharacterized protein V1516DRAFT_661977 [Lipomyces oligophaga]|uniref:uncharacterized protein n=1 Tax=Lipomyces oligophaga TaxID=45792 RepID=UPI0034D016B8